VLGDREKERVILKPYIERLSGLNSGLVWASTFFLRRAS
jgi:hypothetical protein